MRSSFASTKLFKLLVQTRLRLGQTRLSRLLEDNDDGLGLYLFVHEHASSYARLTLDMKNAYTPKLVLDTTKKRV
jgi:hypothetical protein